MPTRPSHNGKLDLAHWCGTVDQKLANIAKTLEDNRTDTRALTDKWEQKDQARETRVANIEKAQSYLLGKVAVVCFVSGPVLVVAGQYLLKKLGN